MIDIFYSDIKLINYAVLFYFLYQMFDFEKNLLMLPNTDTKDLTNFKYQ